MYVSISKQLRGYGYIKIADECTYFKHIKIGYLELKYDNSTHCVLVNGISQSGTKIKDLMICNEINIPYTRSKNFAKEFGWNTFF